MRSIAAVLAHLLPLAGRGHEDEGGFAHLDGVILGVPLPVSPTLGAKQGNNKQ